MRSTDIEYLFGSSDLRISPHRPYADEICDFLDIFAKAIREDSEAKAYPDIMTFSFWIRKGNIQKLKSEWRSYERRIGKGLVFHVAPSNVPINFAYTFMFGLLSGNSNIIKVSSKRFEQTEILCRILKRITEDKIFSWAAEENAVVLYDREHQDITEELSKKCDARVIWGGDATISKIRSAELSPRATEITFADRYSCAVISIEKTLEASGEELGRLAQSFYNDTYLMDQNACSAPHMIFWSGDKNNLESARERFWNEVYEFAGKEYDLAEVKVSEKYTMLCELADRPEHMLIRRYENVLYVAKLDSLPDSITQLRGRFGLFFDCYIDDLRQLAKPLDDKKIQTIAVYGVDPAQLANIIIENNIRGADRIVPIGKTLDIGTIWDGHDVVAELSRCIVCQG